MIGVDHHPECAWSPGNDECCSCAGRGPIPDDAPYVCPGCHAVAGPCAPGCIDAEIERENAEPQRRYPCSACGDIDCEYTWADECPGRDLSTPLHGESQARVDAQSKEGDSR